MEEEQTLNLRSSVKRVAAWSLITLVLCFTLVGCAGHAAELCYIDPETRARVCLLVEGGKIRFLGEFPPEVVERALGYLRSQGWID